MSSSQILAGLSKLVAEANSVIGAFTGSAAEASVSKKIAGAVEVIAAASSIYDSFSRGIEVTEEDVQAAFVSMDNARDFLDAEIARQQGGQL